MPLHPTIRAALDAASSQPPLETLSIAEARAQAKAGYIPALAPPVAAVENIVLPGGSGGIRARIYTPFGTAPFPLLIFFHGSGFVLLDLDTHDAICRRLCGGAACMVVSVDYRLAPEDRFPAAPDDCLAATRWAAGHAPEFGGDAARIAVAGDSAGGALAAVTAVRIRDEGGPRLCGQLLFYPVTDFPEPLRSTHLAFGTGYGLTLDTLRWFWDLYLPHPSLADDPRASPLRARSFADLPPALVFTAEYDVLRDEGERYVDRLRSAGVAAQARRCEGMNHGFLRFAGIIDEASTRIDQASAWLRTVYSTAPR
jgi:acetyl esterase